MKKRGKNAEQSDAPLSGTSLAVLLSCAAMAILHAWGYASTSHFNWGVHFLGFYDAPVTLGAFLFLALFLLPSIQGRIVSVIDRAIRLLARFPVAVLAIAAAAALIGLAKLFPAQLHLLGDGAVLLRSNALAEWGSGLEKSFANQPLMRVIYRWALTFRSSADSAPNPLEIYTFIDLAAAAGFVGILFWFFRKLDRPPLEKVLLASLLFFTASTQFFFGYVENYVLQFVAVTFFCLSGWLALNGRMSVLAPLAGYLLLAGLHLGFLVLLPAACFLILWKMRHTLVKALLALGGLAVLGFGIIVAAGYNLSHLLGRFASESVDFLQPFSASGGNFPYPMFSARHGWDWLNAQWLASPLALALAVLLLVLHRKEIGWKNPVLIFLLIASACGLLFTWIVNFALGMARDWDLLSTFVVPLVVLDIYLLSLPLALSSRRYVLTAVAALTFFHWAPWIGVNASAAKHMARIKLLNSPVFLSPVSQIVHDEALANYFFDAGNYAEARTYYEHFLTIENTNPRIIGNMADTYRKLGEKDKYFAMLQRAVVLKSPDPGVYSNLGVEYASRGDTMKAISFNEQAVAIDSNHRLAHANLGILYASQRKFPAAERHFTAAITLGMREPILFRYAGDMELLLGKFDQALQYYNAYLAMVPGDRKAVAVRDQVRQTIAGQKSP